ncbi:MAG: type II secretion system protein GspD [Bacillota bacterium]
MNSKNKYIYMLYTFYMLILILNTSNVMAGVSDEIIDMSCRNSDLREVLRSLAELADVNLMTDGSVEGSVTLTLKNIQFEEALKLITRTKGLDYLWRGDTVIVGNSDELKENFSDIVMEVKEIKNKDINELVEIINVMYEEIDIKADEGENKLFLKGEKNSIENCISLIEELDSSVSKNDKDYDFVYYKGNDIREIKESISQMLPGMLVIVNENTGGLFLKGTRADLKQAENLIERVNSFYDYNTEDYKEINVDLKEYDRNLIEEKLLLLPSEVMINYIIEKDKVILKGDANEINKFLLSINLVSKEKQIRNITDYYRPNNLKPEKILVFLQKFHENLNTVIVEDMIAIKGEKQEVKEALNAISEIDKPVSQVRIEVRVDEFSYTELNDLGLSTELFKNFNVIDDRETIKNLNYILKNILEMSREKAKARILARPSLQTLNGNKASLLIGDQIPIKVKSQKDGKEIEEIRYIEAGINLVFEPWIVENDEIILKLNPSISSLGEPIGDSLPAINTREIDTEVRIKNGETFAIAGLIKDDLISGKSTHPLINEIPILRKIFTKSSENSMTSEVVIFITPTIIKEKNIEIKDSEEKIKDKAGESTGVIEKYNVKKKMYDKIYINLE